MSARRIVNGTLIGITCVGVAAAVIGGVLGLGLGAQSPVTAAPRPLETGALGVGALTAPPLESGDADPAKIEFEAAELPRTMAYAAVRAQAPLPRPKPVVVPRSAGSAVSRSTAATGGWNSARASWYGPGFYGRTTASGAVLTEGMMNVAHRSMAFGTRIQFEYNGRTCVAVVNDRGPFIAGRTFDLGPGTATALGFSGVGTVRYRILGR